MRDSLLIWRPVEVVSACGKDMRILMQRVASRYEGFLMVDTSFRMRTMVCTDINKGTDKSSEKVLLQLLSCQWGKGQARSRAKIQTKDIMTRHKSDQRTCRCREPDTVDAQ